MERVQILIDQALENVKKNPELAQRQAAMIKKISTKYKIKLPYHIKMHFCKKCKMFITPGVTARYRLGRSTLKSIRITCSFCNYTYRKVLLNDL